MDFKLNDFIATEEMENYLVITRSDYDGITGTFKEETKNVPMFIYKKTLKIIIADTNQGLHEQGQLNGKCLKVHGVKKGDIIEVEGIKYRIIEIFPRMHADFIEFTLGVVRND